MNILDFTRGQLWAIYPPKLESLLAQISNMQAKGLSMSMPLETSDAQEKPEYEIRNGIAIIPIIGPIKRREEKEFFSFFFGDTEATVEGITKSFLAALEDPNVKAILLNIDSPGGSVKGAQVLSNLMDAWREKKPRAASGGGRMASARYW